MCIHGHNMDAAATTTGVGEKTRKANCRAVGAQTASIVVSENKNLQSENVGADEPNYLTAILWWTTGTDTLEGARRTRPNPMDYPNTYGGGPFVLLPETID